MLVRLAGGDDGAAEVVDLADLAAYGTFEIPSDEGAEEGPSCVDRANYSFQGMTYGVLDTCEYYDNIPP